MADVLDRTLALADRAVRGRGGPGADRHRPGARLRQEHLALAGGHPAAGRDDRDRLAGAGLAVQQGLRRRDAGRCRSRSGCPARWPATAVCAWLGARIFRVHEVLETRQVLDMVAAIRGDRPPGPRGAGAGLADDHRCRAVPGTPAAGPGADRRRPRRPRAARGVPPGRRRAAGQPVRTWSRWWARPRRPPAWDPGGRLDLCRLRPELGAGRRAAPCRWRPGLGAGLLDQAGYQGRGCCSRSARTTPARRCAELGADLAGPARTGGAAGHGRRQRAARRWRAPGHLDERSAPFDAEVERAVRDGDLDALLAIDPGLARELMATGRPAWQVLAGALAGTRPRAEIRYTRRPVRGGLPGRLAGPATGVNRCRGSSAVVRARERSGGEHER